MSATLLSRPETEVIHGDVVVESWDNYSPYVDVFVGSEEGKSLRARRFRPARRFTFTLPFLAGALVFAQLLGLVYLYSLDLKLTRQASRLDENIRQTRLQISLTQSRLASARSAPLLSQWAGQLGYRQAQLSDMDDITSNAPFVPPQSTRSGATQ